MTVPPSLSPAWLQNVGKKKRPKAGGQQAQITGLCGIAVTQNHISMTTVMILTVTGGQSPTCKQNMKHRLRCDPFILSYIHWHIAQVKNLKSIYTNKILAFIKQKEKTNLMFHLRDAYFVRWFFFCAHVVVVQGIYNLSYLHTEINTYFSKSFYKLIKQFQDTQALPLLHTTGTWPWIIAHLKGVFVKQLIVGFLQVLEDRFKRWNIMLHPFV